MLWKHRCFCYNASYMGRVFSSEQILMGNHPSPEDFELAVQVFGDGITTGVQQGLFYGAIIFGSVAAGTQDVRSDCDSLIAPTGRDELTERQAARELFVQIHNETGGRVPFERPTVQPKELLRSGRHGLFDRFLMQTLVGPDRKVFGEDPALCLSADETTSAQQVLEHYIANKYNRMCDAYITTDPLDLRENGLQRQLELPVALARKSIQALGEVSDFIDQPRAVDKPAVIKSGRELFGQLGIDQTFNSLVELDRNYTEILYRLIAEKIEASEYDEFLREMHAHLPQTIAWVKDVGRTVLPLFS
jgi:hypothetical protein